MSGSESIFKKIIDREIPADIVYEDEHCLAFYDIEAQAPVHVLLIPKKEISGLSAIEDEDLVLMGHLCKVIRNLAIQLNLEKGYRVVTNSGSDGGQTVDYLHFHILGGRPMNWPPG